MDENYSVDRSMLMARLAALRGEYSSGRRMLGDLELRTAALREQLLRIGGAVQVLEELLHDESSGPRPDSAAADKVHTAS